MTWYLDCFFFEELEEELEDFEEERELLDEDDLELLDDEDLEELFEEVDSDTFFPPLYFLVVTLSGLER